MDNKNKQTPTDNTLYAVINGEKVKIDIPEEGALGLLAYGAVGLTAWRKVRVAAQNNRKNENNTQISEDNE